MSARAYRNFAWTVVAFTVVTILWGSLVRATGSGAGCGGHWPTCGGHLVILPRTRQMWFELPHRLSSGLLLLLVALLAALSMRTFPRCHAARKSAFAAFGVVILEALLGAGLVLFGLVGKDDSLTRAVVIAVHLTNTLLLLGALTLTAWLAGCSTPMVRRRSGWAGWALAGGLVAVAVAGATGAVTALGDTLFPANELARAVRDDLSPTAHVLMRMRLLHPFIAMSVGVYLLWIAGAVAEIDGRARGAARYLMVGVLAQLAVGFIDLFLLAPIVLQVIHLLAADLLWIALVTLTATVVLAPAPIARAPSHAAVHAAASFPDATAQTTMMCCRWRAYLALTKPRVISLLLFTTLAAMFVAAKGWPGGWLLLATAVGGYMAAGAANTINMILDRDIDARMARTSTRPTVTQEIPLRNVIVFAVALTVGSFVLLWFAANLLTALLAMVGLAYYVLVYTVWLKRRTWHNIVIGGAAGAIPPLVGWAAVTGEMNALAWYLFAIIFAWTPVHFWALAMLIREDYARAGVPMLPVVRGPRETVFQIALYAALTAAISIVPFFQRQVGGGYLAVALVLNFVLLTRATQLYRRPERQTARAVFKYSLSYLALLFLALAADRSTLVHSAIAMASGLFRAS